MATPIAIKFSLPLGDLWYASAGIKHVCRKLNTTVDLYLGIDVQMKFYDGTRGALSRQAFEMAKPLLEAQDWCHSVQEYTGQKVDRDLDETQLNPEINIPVMPHGHIARYPFYLYPDMSCDLTYPWIDVPKVPFLKDSILINRTARYRNENIDYSILKPYEDRLFFVGLPDEYERFKQETGLAIYQFEVQNFHELACAINSCRVFIGNQSMCFALAEAMKSPRILEICHFAPNVIPEGANGYDFTYQHGLEHHLNQMMK